MNGPNVMGVYAGMLHIAMAFYREGDWEGFSRILCRFSFPLQQLSCRTGTPIPPPASKQLASLGKAPAPIEPAALLLLARKLTEILRNDAQFNSGFGWYRKCTLAKCAQLIQQAGIDGNAEMHWDRGALEAEIQTTLAELRHAGMGRLSALLRLGLKSKGTARSRWFLPWATAFQARAEKPLRLVRHLYTLHSFLGQPFRGGLPSSCGYLLSCSLVFARYGIRGELGTRSRTLDEKQMEACRREIMELRRSELFGPVGRAIGRMGGNFHERAKGNAGHSPLLDAGSLAQLLSSIQEAEAGPPVSGLRGKESPEASEENSF